MQQQKQIRPIQLISIDEKTKKLQVNKQAIQWLKQKVNQQKHIGIVTVVGKYRTGKSYILNRVLLNQNSGFEVGPTINACTKGLWVWPQLIQNENDPSIQYMVMDTEGLGSLEEGEQNDTKIFLMAMLLSSYFIYNSVGSIDEKAVQNLSLIINLSKMLQASSESEKRDILNCFPSFLWLVRDFALKLVDQKNREITPRQYLQNALKLSNRTDDMTVRKNSVRKELLNFFQDRDCFTLIRPVDDEKKLQDMSKTKQQDMRPRFLTLIKQLRIKVMKDIKKKTFKGKPCSPSMFVELCQYFCDSINKGGLPQIENNWELVCRAQSVRVQKKILREFQSSMDQLSLMDSHAINMKQIQESISKKILEFCKYYQKNVISAKVQKKKELKQKMQVQFEQIKRRLSEAKNNKLQEQISELTSNVENDINSNFIKSIFEIAEKFDETIEKQSKKANYQTLAYLYRKCYEGFKTASFSHEGNLLQIQKYDKNLLTQRVEFYQSSLNREQSQKTRLTSEYDSRERQLKQKVFQLELKSKEINEEYNKAKSELQMIQRKKNREVEGKENIGVY